GGGGGSVRSRFARSSPLDSMITISPISFDQVVPRMLTIIQFEETTMAPTSPTRISGPAPRLAFGVVAPFDMELDAELLRWLPEGVDLLMTRTPFVDDVVTVEFAREVADAAPISVGVRSVTAGRAEVVAYACTSGSF